MSFKPACMLLAVAEPVIRPKVGVATVVPGLFRFTWLNALNISQRNCTVVTSRSVVFLKIERSQLRAPGPARMPSPELPYRPTTGLRKEEVSNQRSTVRSFVGRFPLPVLSALFSARLPISLLTFEPTPR